MNVISVRAHLGCALALLLLLSVIGFGQEPAPKTTVRAELVAVHARKPAPNFILHDADGKAATLPEYRGKVVLLDFWATWCGGCKYEMPWFVQFQQSYKAQGLAVVGVSLDDGGWAVIKPFLASAAIPYRILLGNQATAQRFGIQSMPDTFLIDREGRVAATYQAGVVNRDNIKANIQRLLAEN